MLVGCNLFRNVYRGMNGFKEGYRPRRKMVDSNTGDRT